MLTQEHSDVAPVFRKSQNAADSGFVWSAAFEDFMTSPMKAVLRGGLLLLASFAVGFAAPASSSSVGFFIDSTTPVYDLTGSYQIDQQILGPGRSPENLSLGMALTQDSRGRLQGSGSATVFLGGEIYSASYAVSGRLAGGGKATRAHLVARWNLQQADAAGNPPTTILVQYNLKVTPSGLAGTAKGNVKFANHSRRRINSRISDLPLPAGVDGSWRVQMDFSASNASAGAGEILLPNGRNVAVNLARGMASARGIERIKLLGASADRGNVLNVQLASQTAALQSLSGRILGQSVVRVAASKKFDELRACLECHSPVNRTFSTTPHSQVGVGCADCHNTTAGYSLTSAHAANPYDPTTRPQIDMSGTACGKCHDSLYQEWNSSLHAVVVEDLNPTNLTSSCGRCHSGSVRESLLDGTALPSDANVPIGCPVCHEPHALTGNPALLRNPLASTNDYSLSTSADFASAYDPNIQICAQCHNERGASWTSSSRPPHHSVQYNMLLGTVGELEQSGPHFQPASHALLITNQCVGCHMHQASFEIDQQPAFTNHTFQVSSFDSCLECHPFPELLFDFATSSVSNQIQQIKFELDYWATNDAPAELASKYGTRAWEYTNPGELSPGGPGPDAAEQQLIPVNIQKARFDLYLVLNDGSFGVHNGPYAIQLLETARTWVEAELGP
jgi:Cytochrome c554 and c-prime